MSKIKVFIITVLTMMALLTIGYATYSGNVTTTNAQVTEKNDDKKQQSKKATYKEDVKISEDAWKYPSESKPYPNMNEHKNAYIKVSIEDQRVYIIDNQRVLYTMFAATGENKSPTPKGTFEIQNRGESFYNAESDEGANYWTSFKDWGVYLFHSVPTDKDGKYVENEAHKLGKSSSHGCVRLTIPDAKWINTNIPEGMKVIVE